jgi:hypothetical protein
MDKTLFTFSRPDAGRKTIQMAPPRPRSVGSRHNTRQGGGGKADKIHI